MTAASSSETLGFQTEAKQLLHLMIHSLYSNKEIFIRELISNASDAADKLRFQALADDSLYEDDGELRIRVSFDKEANTLTISDNGIGMSRDDVINNLGTIAKSGTADFLQALTGDQQKDSQLIGQFGVGFYSSFIVADEVEVRTRKAGVDKSEGVSWRSKGEAEFTVATIEKEQRGTEIILHLKESESDFADGFRLRSIVKKYADHISIPVVMLKEPTPEYDEDGKVKDVETPIEEDEVVNDATALWTKPSREIKKDEYKEFYKHVSHDFQDPLSWTHNKVEGKLDYTSLLYIPSKAPFDLWNRDIPRGLKLYVQRVFIMDEAEQFLPLYLRFVKGVIDSNDLSLNVSREILQKDPNIDTMKGALTKKVLDQLLKIAKKKPEDYAAFWTEFGQVIKEGPAEDHANKEKILKLMRFSSTQSGSDVQSVALDDYVERMKPEQEKIFYICAETYNTAKNSPHLEVFKKNGIEVILMHDRIDEWMMGQIFEYGDKKFQDVSKGELDLGKIVDEDEKEKRDESDAAFEDFVKRVKDVLSDEVKDVRITHRLTDSPACLVVEEFEMGAQMRKIMENAGQAVPDSKPTLELNTEHNLMKMLDGESDEERFSDFVRVIFEQATLAEGGQLDDPGSYVARLNKLLLTLTN